MAVNDANRTAFYQVLLRGSARTFPILEICLHLHVFDSCHGQFDYMCDAPHKMPTAKAKAVHAMVKGRLC